MVELRPFIAESLMEIEENIEVAKDLLYEKNQKGLCKLLVKKTEKPSIYLYRIDYNLENSEREDFVYGFVSLMKVDAPGEEKQVFGHERVFQDQAEDLYQCLKTCKVQFNPVVVIYKDYSRINDSLLKKAENMEPIIDAQIDTPPARHRVWAFDDPELIENLQVQMKARRVIMADGHHRYAATELMGEKDDSPWLMAMFVDVHNPGLILLPWHRLLKHFDMGKFLDRLYDPVYGFRVYETKSREDMLSALHLDGKAGIEGRLIMGQVPHQTKGPWQLLSAKEVYFGLQFKNRDKYYLITIDDKKVLEMAAEMGEKIGLELNLLHMWLVNRVIPKATPVTYLSSVEEVEEAIKQNNYQLAIYLPKMKKDDIILKAIWEKKPVPEKATCFRPKAKTGVLFWEIG